MESCRNVLSLQVELELRAFQYVSLGPHLEVCGNIAQFVRPIRATGRMCIIQPDVVDVDTFRDITINTKGGLGTSPYSADSAHILSLDSATTPITSSHSATFMGSLPVIFSSSALQVSTLDWAFL